MSDDRPPIGTRVTVRRNGKQETRTVFDSTLGGHIVYYVGRRPRDLWREYGFRCSVADWNEWARKPLPKKGRRK